MKSKKKILVIANAITLVLTIIINYFASTGYLNGNTMKTISDRYHNLFTPATYAFAIWGLIYIGLIAFVIYTIAILKREKESDVISDVGLWFIISCLANCLWIISWLYDFIGISVLIMIVLLFSLIRIILNTKMELDNPPFRKVALVWWPFALYSGWVSVALIADIAAWLTKMKWDGANISEVTWTMIMIIAAGIINLLMIWTRNLREFAVVGCWGLAAVVVSNWNSDNAIATTGIAVVIIIALNVFVHSAKNFRGFGESI